MVGLMLPMVVVVVGERGLLFKSFEIPRRGRRSLALSSSSSSSVCLLACRGVCCALLRLLLLLAACWLVADRNARPDRPSSAAEPPTVSSFVRFYGPECNSPTVTRLRLICAISTGTLHIISSDVLLSSISPLCVSIMSPNLCCLNFCADQNF